VDTGPTPFDKLARFGAKEAPDEFAAVCADTRWQGWILRRWVDARILPAPLAPERTPDAIALFTHPDFPGVVWAVVVEFKLVPRTATQQQVHIYQSHLQANPHPAPELGETLWAGALIVNLTGTQPATPQRTLGRTGIRTLLAAACANLATLSAATFLRRIERGQLGRGALYWIPLMRGAAQPRTIARWKELVAAEPDDIRRTHFVVAGFVFGEASGHEQVWQEALEGWNMVESNALNRLIEQFRPQLVARLRSEIEQPAELIGQIRGTQRALGLPISPQNELKKLSLTELQSLDAELVRQTRGNSSNS
jgi:hypothetical protein